MSAYLSALVCRKRARNSTGSAGRAFASRDRPSASAGITVWSRYCRGCRAIISSRDRLRATAGEVCPANWRPGK